MSEFMDDLKKVALPVAAVVGPILVIVGGVFWFAAESWVRDIADEQIKEGKTALVSHSTLTGEHTIKLTEHEGKLTQLDEEVEDNEDDIKRHDDRFTDFVRELLTR